MRHYLLLIICLFAWNIHKAQDAKSDSVPPKPKTFWTDTKTEIKLSYANYQGNTEKADLVYGLKFSKKWEKNSLSISGSGTYGEVSGVRNQENYKAGLFDELKINKSMGAYAKYGFLRNVIAGYESVNKLGGGALFTLLDKPVVSFKARLGYEYRSENRVAVHELVEMNTGKAGFRFNFSLMKDVKIKTEVNYQYDFEDDQNYFADGFAKAVFDVNKAIDIEVLYSLNYRNAPPKKTDGTEYEKLDRTFRTTLKIKF